MSSSAGVDSLGPSSKVSATTGRDRSPRCRDGPKMVEERPRTAQARNPAAAAIPAPAARLESMLPIIQSGRMPPNGTIIGYFSGKAPDDRGRYLRDIQQWPDERLEAVHDFIQWMFPLEEPSPVNPDAPVLDADTIAEIRARPELQAAVRGSFERMRRFYEGSR